MCAQRSRPVLGIRAGTWCCVSPVSLFPPRVSRAACGRPSHPGVPYPRSLVRHSTRSVPSACSVRLPFWLSPRALCVCVRSRSRGVRSPLPWVVWRAHLAWSRHWALAGPFHVVRAPPRVLPRSLAPSGVPWGGAVRSRFPPTWLGIVGVAEGRPRGVCLPLLRGASGVRRSPSPDGPPTGRAVGVRYPRAVGAGVRVWGPYSVPLVCTPCGGCVPRVGSVAFVCRRAGWGGGGGACAVPPVCAAGGGL